MFFYMLEATNRFNDLKSKIRELHIPLPNFKYFHKPSSEEEVFENFIGREKISGQLEEWLTEGDSGTYLVTGYRGMGKTSFVGKILHRITRRTKKNRKVIIFTLSCLIFIISSIISFFSLCNGALKGYTLGIPSCNTDEVLRSILLFTTLGSAFLISHRLCLDLMKIKSWKKQNILKKLKINETDYKNHKTWFDKIFGIKNIKENKQNIVIKLNLGHETLKEKDILSLIAKRIYDSYKTYVNDFYTNYFRLIVKTIILFVGAILMVAFLDAINITSILHNPIVDNITLHNSGIVSNNSAIKSELYNSNTINNNNELHNSGLISNNNSASYNSSNLYITFYNFIGGITSKDSLFKDNSWCYPLLNFITPLLIIKIILVFIFYFIVRRIYSFLISYMAFLRKHSTTIILNQLQFLIDRIEAAVTEGDGANSVYTHSTSLFSLNLSRRKNKSYPNASAREIEDELIQIFDKIQTAKSISAIFLGLGKPPKFIIVFDELDKIDPVYNQVIKTEQDVPEFESGVYFQGGSPIRNRKQNVLRLLGNMKLFMSQAKAKFVFISGRELYDAYLADLADREFAASSIFNGVIYVDSFLESSVKQKNILTKTEEYICGYLIPKKWYKKEAQNKYYHEKRIKNPHNNDQNETENKCLKLENPTYHEPNLRMYKKFLIETLIINYLENNQIVIENKNFESYIDFLNLNKNIVKKKIEYRTTDFDIFILYNNASISLTPLEKNEKNNLFYKIKQIFLSIDKEIVFLNQFSFYLIHVCNGSPKKITLYFEQYVTEFIQNPEKNIYRDIQKWDKIPDYCLSFDVNDQQKIGFIYYIAYPIIQTIINKTTHFGDKMLVSISFLIDHILKHHKGGFSYENIEHTPELLEVYHIPNIRDAIDAIFSFLRQNIVTDICGGVYQYKFRKFIADEIKYNSRVSEEISAIFNFTLDESLPVKRHYYKQIKDNEKKYFAVEESLRGRLAKNQYAITLASQLEVLGEIHLLDEEYNEAIQHYQTAFEIIKSELRSCGKTGNNEKDNDMLHLHVLLNHTVLKLGLAKEFKGAYNEAFIIYNTLLDYLVKFRYLDERKLGLEYFYEDNLLTNNYTGEWKTKKIKFYHDINGNSETIKDYHENDKFYKTEVLPFYREIIMKKNKGIDFLFDGDYTLSGLSKVLSSEKQEIISRITLFSEVRFIYQVIIANLFVVEKIDLNGITQENLDLAEDQFKYMYLLTDSKDKFIQAADFYKKLASILFLKNYSNPKPDEFLQMWGFDIYETINEFCFIRSNKYFTAAKKSSEMIAGKFPKEILKEFYIDKYDNLWTIYTNPELLPNLISSYVSTCTNVSNEDPMKIGNLITNFTSFGKEKLHKYFTTNELKKCNKCYKCCKDREKNHPCYACTYVSKSLDIFRRVFAPKVNKYLKLKSPNEILEDRYNKRKSYFFKFLEYFKDTQTNSNYFFVLASTLRIKADISLSCVVDVVDVEAIKNMAVENETTVIEYDVNLNKVNDNILTLNFLNHFLDFLENYYDYQHRTKKTKNIDGFIEHIENDNFSKLEKTILYYWLAAEYFSLNTSPIDSSECLAKILLIFDKYLSIKKERCALNKSSNFTSPFKDNFKLFEDIQNTIIRRVLRNTNITNDDVNYIELQNLKYILRNRPIMHIDLSNLSTTANIADVLLYYCNLELNSIELEDYKTKKGKNPIYFDCYQSTLLSQYDFLSTIHEKILSLEFKEKMNRASFKRIYEKLIKDLSTEDRDKKLDFYSPTLVANYFIFLNKYFDNTYDIRTDLGHFNLFKHCINDPETKAQALIFFISDSLFCLTQIVEILSSGKFSNFSHSFIGNIYHQISQWATLYQLTYHILPQYTNNEKDIDSFISKEKQRMEKRIEVVEDETIISALNERISTFEDNVKNLYNNIKKEFDEKGTNITNKNFETNILDDIGTGNRHFLAPNYSIAMALRHYRKATEVHREGKEYKEMIKKMYIIDDDISNGMHNFSLALERYTMNCGVIEEKMKILRKYYKGSLSYPLENYLTDTSND